MSDSMPLASWKTQIFESVLGFLPDWVQITALALVVLAVAATWAVKIKRGIAHRRAVRLGTAAQYGEDSGAHYLGQYAPRRQSGGADHPGAPAPGPTTPATPATPAPRPQPSGADFLGAYAPPQRQGDGTA
ncbi:hypothetical protein HTV45_14240 [Streptomyces sp. CHD11]|uniref:hypothetical protein n=1 Tax=Streptomyces sp. CHD11 TaxID=2741325 RepID=UPI001BFC76A2|nr:hypothetical protein [Streptomyces sp. CHD11]MBT3152026.1 hypothetical protein [Streptomyces sp. CHD11]